MIKKIRNLRLFKIGLRKKYRKIREKMNLDVKKSWDKKILKKICILNDYKKSETVLTYISKEIEVDTTELIKKCFSDGKKVAAPVCNKDQRTMQFYYITSEKDLKKGTFGLLEPITSCCEEYVPSDHDLCIVPGFCFDNYGYRLGYGCGYYDRFLQNFNGVTAGVCYSNCIVKNLPHGKFDQKIDFLVTNYFIRKIYNRSESRYNFEKNQHSKSKKHQLRI